MEIAFKQAIYLTQSTMSDTKSLNLTALVSKKTRRAKARLLQNFGKTEKTTDELFEVYQQNFSEQHTISLNFQKSLKHYFNCVRELNEASKNLSHCIAEIHEKNWPKHDIIENNGYDLEHISEDIEEKLKETVLEPLEHYISQFSEIREKISKRGRKLVDYDSERHAYESLQASQTTKPSDDTKINRCRDQMIEAQKVYETLNNELHEELPALYENRVPLIITVLQRLFSSKLTYHAENVDLCKSYLDCVEHLARATEKDSDSDIGSAASAPLPVSNSSRQYRSRLLNKVKASYKYMAEDEDELSFEKGEIIQVVEYDDPAEQEEGWLVGIKESGEKGLFPANFTRPL